MADTKSVWSWRKLLKVLQSFYVIVHIWVGMDVIE